MQPTCQVVHSQFLISVKTVTQTKNTKFIAVPQISSKASKQGRYKRLYCLFIATDSIVDAIGFIQHIVL